MYKRYLKIFYGKCARLQIKVAGGHKYAAVHRCRDAKI